MTFADYLAALESGTLHHFGEWHTLSMTAGQPGVYTIWCEADFIYVGISYRAATETTNPQARGLFGRLCSHASGRRSGDQFNIYICDRFVIPTLSPNQIQAVGDAELSLDALTRDYIRTHLGFRYVFTESGDEARAVERTVRRDGLPGSGQPFLNPA